MSRYPIRMRQVRSSLRTVNRFRDRLNLPGVYTLQENPDDNRLLAVARENAREGVMRVMTSWMTVRECHAYLWGAIYAFQETEVLGAKEESHAQA